MRRWDPFSDTFRIWERFGGRFEQGVFSDDDLLEEGLATAIEPPADVFEDREGLTIEVELPGVLPRQVAVSVCGDAVVVEAEREFTRPRERSVSQLEGRYGVMRRAFQLPMGARPEQAMAELKCGVLRIFVPCVTRSATVTRELEVEGDEEGRPIPLD